MIYRKLVCARDQKFYDKIKAIYDEVKNKPYDINPIDWISSGIGIQLIDTKEKDSFWCSALIAYVYDKLGFIPKKVGWTLLTPKDLSSIGKIPFENCTLLTEVALKEPLPLITSITQSTNVVNKV